MSTGKSSALVTSFHLYTYGLRYYSCYRALMVVDKDNNFVTARIYSELYMVQPIVHGSVLTVKHKDMEDIRVNLAEVLICILFFVATIL